MKTTPPVWEVVEEEAASTTARGQDRPPADQPSTHQDELQETARRCRKKVAKRALLAAGVAMVPVPGLDWVTDIGVLMKLLPQISAEFGLTPEQIERLSPERRLVVFKVISASGGLLVGRMVTRDLVIKLVKMVGLRLTTQQASKYVPLAGQAISAALTFSALKFVCEQHIQECMQVARLLQLPAPQPP